MNKRTKFNELLELVDRDMNAMDPNNYSRLLANLATIIYHRIDNKNDCPNGMWIRKIDRSDFSEEEKSILQTFLQHENTRPVILASVYSRVIKSSFKIHYSNV